MISKVLLDKTHFSDLHIQLLPLQGKKIHLSGLKDKHKLAKGLRIQNFQSYNLKNIHRDFEDCHHRILLLNSKCYLNKVYYKLRGIKGSQTQTLFDTNLNNRLPQPNFRHHKTHLSQMNHLHSWEHIVPAKLHNHLSTGSRLLTEQRR